MPCDAPTARLAGDGESSPLAVGRTASTALKNTASPFIGDRTIRLHFRADLYISICVNRYHARTLRPVFSLTMLGSGSAGNSALVATDHCKILVDGGLSARQLVLHLEQC